MPSSWLQSLRASAYEGTEFECVQSRLVPALRAVATSFEVSVTIEYRDAYHEKH